MKSQILWSVLFLIVVYTALAEGQNCGLSAIRSTWKEVKEASTPSTPTVRTPFSIDVTNGCKRCDAAKVTLQMTNKAGASELVYLKPIPAAQTVNFIYRSVGALAHIKPLTANFVNCR